MSLLDNNFNMDGEIVKSLCIEYFTKMFNPYKHRCVVEFLSNEQLDYQDILQNPHSYVLGRYLKQNPYPTKHIYKIMIFKVDQNFPKEHPHGTYKSVLYLDWKLNLSNFIEV